MAQVVSIVTTTSTLANLIFANQDNVAVRHSLPVRSWIGTDNTVRHGGTGSEGMGTITVVPVVYSPTGSMRQVTVNVTGTARSNDSYTFVSGVDVLPCTLTYGAFSSAAAPAGSRSRRCTGISTGADLTAAVSAAFNDAGLRLTLPVVFVTSPTGVPPVGLPAVIRADYSQNILP